MVEINNWSYRGYYVGEKNRAFLNSLGKEKIGETITLFLKYIYIF